MAGFHVRLRGLKESEVIPNEIEFALVRFRQELLPPLVEDFRKTEPPGGDWPKSRRRKTIQEQTRGLIRGDTLLIGTFHSRYARHLDEGGTVQPRRKTFMRFRDKSGNWAFVRGTIHHRPRPFFGRILTQIPAIVATVYERVFAEIGRR